MISTITVFADENASEPTPIFLKKIVLVGEGIAPPSQNSKDAIVVEGTLGLPKTGHFLIGLLLEKFIGRPLTMQLIGEIEHTITGY